MKKCLHLSVLIGMACICLLRPGLAYDADLKDDGRKTWARVETEVRVYRMALLELSCLMRTLKPEGELKRIALEYVQVRLALEVTQGFEEREKIRRQFRAVIGEPLGGVLLTAEPYHLQTMRRVEAAGGDWHGEIAGVFLDRLSPFTGADGKRLSIEAIVKRS